jgi:hypothetical protein
VLNPSKSEFQWNQPFATSAKSSFFSGHDFTGCGKTPSGGRPGFQPRQQTIDKFLEINPRGEAGMGFLRLVACKGVERNKLSPRRWQKSLPDNADGIGRNKLRKIAVGPSIENSSCYLLPSTAPLLEKEWDSISITLIMKGANPIWLHRARTRSTFSADNHPSNSLQINLS